MFRSALMPLNVGNILVLYICLYCLESLCIPDTVTGVLIELFLIYNYTLFELVGPLGLSISCFVRFQWWVPAVGACHFASLTPQDDPIQLSVPLQDLVLVL